MRPVKKSPIPQHIFTLIHKQTSKFNFRSKILRDLIEYQISKSSGDINALNTARHYVNSKGESPYDELWKPIHAAINRHCVKADGSYDSKKQIKLTRLAHHKYSNFINGKIYAYTIKSMHKKLKG